MALDRSPRCRLASLFWCAILLCSSSAVAEEQVPGSRQASILTRALAYNRDLKERAGDAIVVAVLYRSGNQASETMSTEIHRSFEALESYSVRGLPFRVVRLAYDNPAALRLAIRNQGVDALYVCAALDADIPQLAAVTREAKILSIAGMADYIARGLTLGVFVVDKKPTIYLNVTASQQEGAEFSSDFVKVTKSVESRASN